jgi:hypothetical protein
LRNSKQGESSSSASAHAIKKVICLTACNVICFYAGGQDTKDAQNALYVYIVRNLCLNVKLCTCTAGNKQYVHGKPQVVGDLTCAKQQQACKGFQVCQCKITKRGAQVIPLVRCSAGRTMSAMQLPCVQAANNRSCMLCFKICASNRP